MDRALIATIRAVARARGEDVSAFIRGAVKAELARLSFLTSLEKKALGIQSEVSASPDQETSRKSPKGKDS